MTQCLRTWLQKHLYLSLELRSVTGHSLYSIQLPSLTLNSTLQSKWNSETRKQVECKVNENTLGTIEKKFFLFLNKLNQTPEQKLLRIKRTDIVLPQAHCPSPSDAGVRREWTPISVYILFLNWSYAYRFKIVCEFGLHTEFANSIQHLLSTFGAS